MFLNLGGNLYHNRSKFLLQKLAMIQNIDLLLATHQLSLKQLIILTELIYNII
jgi:hypothetical protein